MKQYQRALVQIESQILSFLVLAPDELDSDFLWKIPLLLLFLLVLVHSTDWREGQLEGKRRATRVHSSDVLITCRMVRTRVPLVLHTSIPMHPRSYSLSAAVEALVQLHIAKVFSNSNPHGSHVSYDPRVSTMTCCCFAMRTCCWLSGTSCSPLLLLTDYLRLSPLLLFVERCGITFDRYYIPFAFSA